MQYFHTFTFAIFSYLHICYILFLPNISDKFSLRNTCILYYAFLTDILFCLKFAQVGEFSKKFSTFFFFFPISLFGIANFFLKKLLQFWGMKCVPNFNIAELLVDTSFFFFFYYQMKMVYLFCWYTFLQLSENPFLSS